MIIDICDFGQIYHSHYEYILPESMLRSYYDGNSFDRPNIFYTVEEKEEIDADIQDIYFLAVGEAKPGSKFPLAVFTAGAPGAGKTTLMRANLASQDMHFAYIDPDDVCLKNMKRTWKKTLDRQLTLLHSELSEKERLAEERKIRQGAYDYWRPASNAAAHLILANLIREKYSFYYGTTSTSPMTWKTLKFLKDLGYEIKLLHLTAPDDVRWESIRKRDREFVQTTEQDTKVKGELFPQRISDAYLKYADRIDFYYRGGVDEPAVLAAVWIQDSGNSLGKTTVKNQKMYEAAKKVHNEICERINRKELFWENTVEAISEIIFD